MLVDDPYATRCAILDAAALIAAPHVRMRPAVFPDGNQWCCLYGNDLQVGVAGFGETPARACAAFDLAWSTEKTPPPPSMKGRPHANTRPLSMTRSELVLLPRKTLTRQQQKYVANHPETIPLSMTGEMVEEVAFAMACVIARRHGHEPDNWMNDERREEARAAIAAIQEQRG